MSLDFFRAYRGIELDESTQVLTGTGTPGAAGDTAAAPVGSAFLSTSDGSLWTKVTAGTGTDKWQKQASEQYVNNALGSTVSWREPALVRDNVAVTLPTGSAGSSIIIDGVSVTDGGRVLFSALTGGGGKNVYIYNQAAGTFAEDANQESSGDAVYVQSGTSAGKTFIFNGTAWVQSDQSSLDEQGFINSFIGKTAAGSEMPTYASNNFVVDASSLKAAIGALDTELGANVSVGHFVSPSNKVNANIQAIDAELGANVTDGNFITAAGKINGNIQALDTKIGPNLVTGNFVTSSQTVLSAIQALDTELGPNVATGNFIASTNKVNANLTALDTALGAAVIDGTYVLASASTNANVQALDTAVATTNKKTSVTNVTSITVIDSIASVGAAKWLVRVVDASNPNRVYATEVYAITDGTSVDYTKYGTLKIGTSIPGLAVSVDLSGTALRLNVAATAAVNVEARRVAVI